MQPLRVATYACLLEEKKYIAIYSKCLYSALFTHSLHTHTHSKYTFKIVLNANETTPKMRRPKKTRQISSSANALCVRVCVFSFFVQFHADIL